jgi:hypothetical protein
MINDVFRINYTPISDEKKETIKEIKLKAQELYDLIHKTAIVKEGNTALMYLETSIMWIVKGLTK